MKRFYSTLAVACIAVSLASPGLGQQSPSPTEPPRGRVEEGVFVPEGSTLAEVREQQAANKAQADAAQQQTAANQAMVTAYAEAKAAYDAELVRLETERVARDAQAARAAADHEAAMAKWRADVAACADGETSRCAPPVED